MSCASCSGAGGATAGQTADQVQMLLAKKQLDMLRLQGQAAIQLLEAVASGKAPGKGDGVDVSA